MCLEGVLGIELRIYLESLYARDGIRVWQILRVGLWRECRDGCSGCCAVVDSHLLYVRYGVEYTSLITIELVDNLSEDIAIILLNMVHVIFAGHLQSQIGTIESKCFDRLKPPSELLLCGLLLEAV
jgi:hypothetical protein